MRRLIALVIAVMLAALPALSIQALAATHAAQVFNATFGGRLVAAPRSTDLTQPQYLLLQAGKRTILVQVTSSTQIVDRNFMPITLADLRNKDRLLVSGKYNRVVLVATRIRDVSLVSLIPLQVKGQLAALPVAGSNLLCLINASISGAAAPRFHAQTASPCPAGQLPIYLTSGTLVRNASGGTASLGDLRVGDTLAIAGTYDGSQITAVVIKDTSLPASQVVLTGRLVATPQSTDLTQPVNLLVQAGDRTVLVQVTAQTQLIDRLSNAITLASLQDHALLQVTGSYNGLVLVATQIRDQSLPLIPVQVKGQLATAVSADASVLCLANSVVSGAVVPQAQAQAVSACPAGQLPVYLTSNTQYFSSTGVAIQLTSLRPGDLLQVSGVLDADQFTASAIIDTAL